MRQLNGKAEKPIPMNRSASAKKESVAPPSSDSSGLLQLAICVLGIYASLYGCPV